ncbi:MULTISPECIES: M56 family metallopeptidase [Tsukamurella]|uniref:M48 family metalloprotease n=1 Tax=Tsukamurella strandjordii TaxID=147577 RepID=A0AA90NF45_9ACTN|nr:MULTISPECIES: M56 family metallopeptidase [Tsukamurella]MDP0397214.1 M48 family metalloprotease [Tsukamurella strandjordii]GIZ98635.1 integral membrane protein [Tsukamurella sp. TY48]
MAAVIFGLLALLLAGPVPLWLSKASWPVRAPRAALVLWQAIALAAVLSAFSAGLVIASWLLVPGPDGRPTTNPIDEIRQLGIVPWTVAVIAFAFTLVIGARLITSTVRLAVRTRRRRARHRNVVDILSQAVDGDHPVSAADLRVLGVDEPLAYCLPGLRHRVVVSEGTLNQLSHDELTAVLAHERAHLRSRHDLVLEAFTAVHHAFPRGVRSSAALDSVELLVELLADDKAVAAAGPLPLANALVTCAKSPAPRGALAVGSTGTVVRVERLSEPAAGPLFNVGVYIVAGLILVVPTVAVAVPWLTELYRLFTH